MKHLSALDALFLQLETPETPMHVGSLMLLEEPGTRGKGGIYARLRDHFASRLHLAPVFSRRLTHMPLDVVNPVWVHEPNVDIERHVRHLKLPKPGSMAQLEAAVAKLHETALDRGHPLWEFTVIEGLASGEVGIYAKIHHAALDGQGGIAVAQALLDSERAPKRVPGEAAKAKPGIEPSKARMLGAAFLNTVAQYGKVLQALPSLVKAVSRAGAVALTVPGAKKSKTFGPPTPLNVAIGAGRTFVAQRIPLSEAKEIARAFQVTLNDVVLATCAGALRRQFARDKAALSKAMIGAVPASLRAPGDNAAANSVTMMLVGLATNIADPLKRLAAIHAGSTKAKMITGSLKDAIPADLPSLGIPWLMAAATPLYRKAAEANRIPAIANVIISNVPGPPVPLYMAGAEMKAYYPVSIVTHGLALNITILSYNGSLHYGLLAAAGVTNVRAFARHLAQSHAELLKLARLRKK